MSGKDCTEGIQTGRERKRERRGRGEMEEGKREREIERGRKEREDKKDKRQERDKNTEVVETEGKAQGIGVIVRRGEGKRGKRGRERREGGTDHPLETKHKGHESLQKVAAVS